MILQAEMTALRALAAKQRKNFRRPLRVAIDTSILEFLI